MTISKKDLLVLAWKIKDMRPGPCRLAAFNVAAEWVKEVKPDYSLVDMYDIVFYSDSAVKE